MDILTLIGILLLYNWISKVFGTEYCSGERFNASCPAGHVVVASSASYGRMRLGRCVKRDLGRLGCRDDVLHVVDRYCSGRQICDIFVPHPEMKQQSQCDSEYVRYLDAEYTCAQIATPRRPICTSAVVIDASTRSGNVASLTSRDTGCGTSNAPWIIEAAPGQQIQLTLLVFSWQPQVDLDDQADPCHHKKYGYMIDLETQITEFICGLRENKRYVAKYLSRGHRVQLILDDGAIKEDIYLIQFQAIGCPDIVRPAHSWVQRNGNSVLVGCDVTKQQWHLTCKHNRWVGVIGNCSQYILGPKSANAKSKGSSFETGSAILVVMGVALLLCACIVAVGIICLRRIPKENRRPPVHCQYPVVHRRGDELYHIKSEEYKDTYSDNSNTYSKNEYTHIWEYPFMEDAQSENAFPPPPHSTPITSHVLNSFSPIAVPVSSTDGPVSKDMRLANQKAPRVKTTDSATDGLSTPVEDSTPVTT